MDFKYNLKINFIKIEFLANFEGKTLEISVEASNGLATPEYHCSIEGGAENESKPFDEEMIFQCEAVVELRFKVFEKVSDGSKNLIAYHVFDYLPDKTNHTENIGNKSKTPGSGYTEIYLFKELYSFKSSSLIALRFRINQLQFE